MADFQPGHHPRLTAEDIKDELWQEVARYQPGVPPRPPAMPSVVPAVAALDLPALLQLDGTAFVDAAYRTVLGRMPDDEGVSYFMRALAGGDSKVALLGQLGRSQEGKRVGRTVPGLGRRYAVHRLYRIPVLGRAVRVLGAVLRRSGLSSLLGGSSRPQPSRRHLQAAVEQLTVAMDAVQQRAALQDAAIQQLTDRLRTLKAGDAQADPPSARPDPAAQRPPLLADPQAASVHDLAVDRRLTGLEDSSLEAMLALHGMLDDQGRRLLTLESMLNGEAVAAQIDAGAAALRQSLDTRLRQAEAVVERNRQDVVDQVRRIGLLLDAVRGGQDGEAVLAAQDERSVDSLYVDFEDRFRGTRADIKQRLRFCLAVLAEAEAGSAARPVLDIGCGRGEFLELLHDEGLTARGVDSNSAMVAACRDLGLEATQEDGLAYLGRQPAGSLGAVTGFHVLEHLPHRTMVRLFDEALRVLAPGGLVVFETPNPANLLVASRWFYLDPTHRNPLPSEMVAMIAEARGFGRISIVELHPMSQRFGGNDPVLREQLDQLFHGPQDYALLARKP